MDDRALMALRADAGFTYDVRGRMLLSNEPLPAERRPAPRLFLGRTRAGHVVRLGATVPDTLVRRLEAIIDRLPAGAGSHLSPDVPAALRRVLAEQAPVAAEGGGPAYRFPASFAPPGEAVRLTDANRALARATYPWLYHEAAAWQPCFAVVRDGAAVSVCFSARLTGAAAEAGVDTLPDFRGRGFASAVTAAWGQAILSTGRVPFYSTAWHNGASQGVARRVGLVMFGADTTLG